MRSSARDASTVGSVYRRAAAQLTKARLHYGHGTNNARDEAAYLVLHVLGHPHRTIESLADVRVSRRDNQRLDRLIARRIGQRIPAAYLTGEAWIGGLPFYIDRRAIIPRSHIADLLGSRLSPWVRGPVRSVLDLCTGSGCLAVLAAQAFPRAHVDATDRSASALAVARLNIKRHRLGRRIRLIQSDLYAALQGRRYDLIITNPPYVTLASMRRLPQEYLHEPQVALAGGKDGLDLVRRIIDSAPAHLRAHGRFVCEVGSGRARLERAYPAIPFSWPLLDSGQDAVCILEASQFGGIRREQL